MEEPLPWKGDRASDSSGPPGGATLHIIAVTGYDEKTKTYTVHDPARGTALQVDVDALMAFLEPRRGAWAVSPAMTTPPPAGLPRPV